MSSVVAAPARPTSAMIALYDEPAAEVAAPSREYTEGKPAYMNISVKSEYALKAIFDLSTRPPTEPVKIADIAKRQKIPQKFLELILSSLKQGGFVESRRGADGGYRLARPASEITVGQLLAYVENGKKSSRSTPDAFTDLWKRVDSAISDIIDHTTFAELDRQWREAQQRYVPTWDI